MKSSQSKFTTPKLDPKKKNLCQVNGLETNFLNSYQKILVGFESSGRVHFALSSYVREEDLDLAHLGFSQLRVKTKKYFLLLLILSISECSIARISGAQRGKKRK